jgi:thioredoxin-related protein
LKDKGLELIAVNASDSKTVINKYVEENKFTFLIGMEAGEDTKPDVSQKYGVQAYPTNYILDPNGKVVYRTTGFDETAIRKALEKLGVK